MGVNCRQVAELLIDYVSGELAVEERTLVEEHLNCCQPCVVYLTTYRLTIQVTRKLRPVPMPREVAERLRKFLDEECRKQLGEGQVE